MFEQGTKTQQPKKQNGKQNAEQQAGEQVGDTTPDTSKAVATVDSFDITKMNDAASIEEVFEAFESLPDDQLSDNSQFEGEYLNFDEWKIGDKKNFAFIERITMNLKKVGSDERQDVAGVKLIDKEGNIWVSASTVLVNQLNKLEKIPAMIRITYNGTKTSEKTKGKYTDLTILTL